MFVKNCDFRVFNDWYTLALTDFAFQTMIRAGLGELERLPNGFTVRLKTSPNLQMFPFGQYYMLTMNETGLKEFRDTVGSSTVPLIQRLLDYITGTIEQFKQQEVNWQDKDEFDPELEGNPYAKGRRRS